MSEMTQLIAEFPELVNEEGQVDLAAVLSAWNSATDRLQNTHEMLREEVGRLSDELEIKNRELARKNRLADLGQMASHIAHEVRNSLMPMTLYLSLLRRRLSDDSSSQDVLKKIDSGLTALDATVNDLLHFTSERDPQVQRFGVRKLIEDVCDAIGPQLLAQGIVTELDIPDELQLSADRDMLRRAFLNLVLNALDVMPNGGELVITGYEGPNGVELEIADSGPGVEEDVCDKVFEPFFTTKGAGTGLGLAIVHRIADVHGGDVAVMNCPEGGAAFTLRIPQLQMEAAA